MRLGKDTASLTNYGLSGTNGQPTPEPGMGVTLLHWTDRHAGTITRVSPSGKTLWFRNDREIRTDDNGMSECQQYRFEVDPDAPERKATLKTDGAWYVVQGPRLRLGERDAYYDFSF